MKYMFFNLYSRCLQAKLDKVWMCYFPLPQFSVPTTPAILPVDNNV